MEIYMYREQCDDFFFDIMSSIYTCIHFGHSDEAVLALLLLSFVSLCDQICIVIVRYTINSQSTCFFIQFLVVTFFWNEREKREVKLSAREKKIKGIDFRFLGCDVKVAGTTFVRVATYVLIIMFTQENHVSFTPRHLIDCK